MVTHSSDKILFLFSPFTDSLNFEWKSAVGFSWWILVHLCRLYWIDENGAEITHKKVMLLIYIKAVGELYHSSD